ncbi:hybrid sensor histidine kinase/response regulator [uncultured Oscillibacter sp.]|uniref:hybrid sensor histidine kinase/response regulator n=1 Tax=uncultured Oscillibacter sp. TaxID=876091 RepID=UPI0025D24974|nr:hybrid sensor histidine kinase/response regulator [uncultured Oscillibacter sp.]
MSTQVRGQRRSRLRRILRGMRLNFITLGLLIVLTVLGLSLIRTSLLKNAQETGTALTQIYAAEGESNLTIYETLLSFGTSSISDRLTNGTPREELVSWLDLYFQRVESVLGKGIVDPYMVLNGKILAANPWDGDESYDVSSTEWYQKAIQAGGEVIFTNVYTDAISQRPVITAAQQCGDSDAVLAFDIFPENFQFQFDSLERRSGNSFFLCDSTGTIIYQQTAIEQSPEAIQQYLIDLIQKIDAGELDDYATPISDMEGNLRAVSYTRMDNGWISIITVPYGSILASFNWLILFFIAIISIFFLALLGMTWRDMKINTRMERANETVQALGNSYYALYRVNFQQNTYELIKGPKQTPIPSTGNYSDLLRLAGNVIEANAYQEFLENFSAENIRRLVSRQTRDFGGDFLRRFGEDYRWVNARILYDESLSPEEVVLSFREVDQEKQQQLKERKLLEDSLEITRQNEASKQSFFSSMSHDMRTPLNAIIGLSQLAGQHTDSPSEISKYLCRINSASRQLLELINDILDMSRMEQGMVTLNNSPIDLQACVEECLETFRYQAEQQGKQLTWDFSLENTHLLADPFRLQQILNNLLSNAFKFTKKDGRIALHVTQLDSGEYAKYKFVISDNGIGMSPEFLPHLFDPYYREMRFTDRQAVGTGLGMSIVKSLVTQMNGEISVESRPDEGTTFTVILPFPVIETDSEPDAASAPAESFSLEGLHILLAEDNEVNMEISTELLTMHGVQVTQAWDGQEALDLFSQSAPFAFDAVLLDMQMPRMDGCEAARRIRALSRPDARRVPIIAVTANAFSEDIAATAAAGMNAHISKPIDFNGLCQTLEYWTHRARNQQQEDSAKP